MALSKCLPLVWLDLTVCTNFKQKSGREGALIVHLGKIDGLECVRLDCVISSLVEEGADDATMICLSSQDAGSCTYVLLCLNKRSCTIVSSDANILQDEGRCAHREPSVSCNLTMRLLTGEAT